MAKPKSSYRCSACGHTVAKWVGRCPECGEWGTVDEVAALPSATASHSAVAPSSPAVPITQVDAASSNAIPTGIGEFDRVLGRGVVPGSVILLAGEPGVGKSTLLLETVKHWARSGRTALYLTGEESAGQVRLRAERTDAVHENVYLAAETDLATVLGHVDAVRPSLLVVDSVQTMVATGTDGVTGGVTQIRAVTTALVSLAKNRGIAVILVGHVTKDGAVAGPRSLEHLVDVVLSFEGDRHTSLRMVRGIKNRFGSADEVGCFEQRSDGIHQVTDPSGLFVHHHDSDVSGSSAIVAMDGKRALVGEIQALLADSKMANPRRAVSGLDSARASMVLAVLQGRSGLPLGEREVYLSTVGGMKVTEPAADLGIALAVNSFIKNKPTPRTTVAIGEVGLAGEVRRVSAVGRRVAEAKRLGFTHAIIPAGSDDQLPEGIRITRVSVLGDAMRAAFVTPVDASRAPF
ncbi:DNA repair protein RadA [Gordonia otitidis]|uniref:DNA repair protein RadA n=1 Tax=Gordonia otitidis (strain DSM 44809 / CCUG 52243 / JCM 12355 / NBRC 100426 / IFM 10032) TaxID=1108044 RepID=H5TQ13_GORO1|nr:DNA repair protein RadA [Gordonia otitidis]GAB35571.1 DNA repair protein RadA [Gordonia otitidis NBRC 100426]